jgi:hypothetical protein
MGKHGAKRSPDGQIGLVYEGRGGVKRLKYIDERGEHKHKDRILYFSYAINLA